MLGALRRIWWGFRARSAHRHLRASVRRGAAGDPVAVRITELCHQADEQGIEALTARQQLVVRTWAARGVIGNGGFRYLLEGSWPLPAVADGYRALGFPAAADACERVARRVAEAPALDEAGRRAWARGSPGADGLDAEDEAVLDVSWEALQAAAGDFMRRHPRDFPGLPPLP